MSQPFIAEYKAIARYKSPGRRSIVSGGQEREGAAFSEWLPGGLSTAAGRPKI
jgi:hypothetical protein